jgi:hypothetical protein
VTTAKHISQARSAALHLPDFSCHDPADSAAKNYAQACRDVGDARIAADRPRLRATTRTQRLNFMFSLAHAYNRYQTMIERAGEDVSAAPLIDIAPLEASLPASDLIAIMQLGAPRPQREVDTSRDAEIAAEWRATGRHRGRLGRLNALPVMLRVSAIGDRVETSHGAAVSLDNAHTLYRYARLARDSGGHPNFTGKATGERFDGFPLNEIRRDGSLVVGCHDIAWTEIEAIAQQLKWGA